MPMEDELPDTDKEWSWLNHISQSNNYRLLGNFSINMGEY